MTFANTRPLVGSEATPPQLPPPTAPGKMTAVLPLSFIVHGVYGPSLKALFFSQSDLQKPACSGVMLKSSDLVMLLRANCSDEIVNGCVGAVFSPSMALFGTGRSSMGKIGS